MYDFARAIGKRCKRIILVTLLLTFFYPPFFWPVPPSPVNSKAPNLESRLIELEFENERIKKQLASTVEPQELQRIKDALEDMEQSKKSYEVS